MNCSGKHAGMLATCVVNGWSTSDYLDQTHPLQRAITATIEELAGDVAHVGVDGCGAPAHVLSLRGLASAFATIAARGDSVWQAMTTHPAMVGGADRDVTKLMLRVPGLMAKDGAEGVFAAALPDGRAVAVKVADGGYRAAPPVLVDALARLGVDVSEVADAGGAGRPGARRAGRRGPFDRVRIVSAPTFETLDDVEYGRVDQIADGIRRVIAENPSKFTYRGTGTYIVGHGDVVVVDPGPVLDSHRDALAAALAGERVRGILITHCHSDHSPLAAWLRAETGAPTFAFGPHGAVEDADDGADEIDDGVKVEETIDVDFVPDVAVADGEEIILGPGLTMTAVHTPGHTSNHTCYALAEPSVLFTGDHVMGWSTTVVSPPDGDMADYIESLRKVAGRRDAMLIPTHGPPRRDGPSTSTALVEHRLERERQVVDAVRRGLDTIPAIVAELYADVRTELHKPAGRSVLAHLVKLVDEGIVAVDGGSSPRLASTYATS